jgi:hypothetical protein
MEFNGVRQDQRHCLARLDHGGETLCQSFHRAAQVAIGQHSIEMAQRHAIGRGGDRVIEHGAEGRRRRLEPVGAVQT